MRRMKEEELRLKLEILEELEKISKEMDAGEETSLEDLKKKLFE